MQCREPLAARRIDVAQSVHHENGAHVVNPSSRNLTPTRPASAALVIAALLMLATACTRSSGGTADPRATAPLQTPITQPQSSPATVEESRTIEPTMRPTGLGNAAAPSPTNPQLAQAIDDLVADESGVYGVVVMQPDGTIGYQRNADTPFVAASLYKLILLVNIFEKREAGELTFDQELELLPEYFPDPNDFPDGYYDREVAGSLASIDELVFATGTYSSNVAAHALLSLTNTASLDRTTIELGLTNTYLFIDAATIFPWPAELDAPAGDVEEATTFVESTADGEVVNVTTPRDMSRFFQLLLAGEVVNADVSAELLDILKHQMVDDRFPYLLPYPTDMAHKTGNLDHVVHDVGIIWSPEGPVILAAMVEDPPDDDHATQIVQRLALIAYGTYDVPPFTEVAVPEESDTAEPNEAVEDG